MEDSDRSVPLEPDDGDDGLSEPAGSEAETEGPNRVTNPYWSKPHFDDAASEHLADIEIRCGATAELARHIEYGFVVKYVL